MQTTVAVMGIIVKDTHAVEQLNATLHAYGEHIIGRMGLPYRQKGIHIISIALDAPKTIIAELADKLGALDGVSVQTAYSEA